MQIGLTSNVFLYARVNATPTDYAAVPYNGQSSADISQLALNERRVAQLGAAVNEFDDLLSRAQVRNNAGLASAISHSALNLATNETATRLESSEQINTATTSYTPFGPEFTGSGSSDAEVTLAGVYDGRDGDDTLRFKVTRGGVHGDDKVEVKVYNSADDKLDTIKINANHDLDREYSLKNGIIFTLGEGQLVKNDEFFIDVFATTPSDVDPDKAFNGTRDDRPDFDYGQTVVAGSFELNGELIAVNADDTINTVVQRINDSDAGVDAAYDSASDAITLLQRQPGPLHDITVANDTSGFVSATKLGGSPVTGQSQESGVTLNQTQKLSSVSSGNISINDNTIAIDVTTDSLVDIIERINNADMNVTASLLHDGQRVLLKSNLEGESLTIDDNDTGLFNALELTEKTYKATSRNGFSARRAYQIADQITVAGELVNDIFNPEENRVADSAALSNLRNNIISALTSSTPDGDSGFGIRFDLDEPVGRNFMILDRQVLTRTQQKNIGPAREYFQNLATTLRNALSRYQASYGLVPNGTLLNATA